LATGKEVRRIKVPRSAYHFALSRDSKTLAANCARTVRLWDVDSGRELRHFQADGSLAFSHDGRKLLSSNWTALRLWDTASGKELGKLTVPPSGQVQQPLAFSADDRMVVTLQQNEILFTDLSSGRQVRRIKVNSRLLGDASFSSDGKLMAVCGDKNAIHLFDLNSGQQIRKFDNHVGVPAGFTPDNKMVLSASHEGIVFWEIASGKEIRRLPNIGIPVSVALSPDGKLLAQGYPWFSGLHLWDVASGQELLRRPGHIGPVSRVVFAPDGKTLISRSEEEKTLRFWDTATGAELRALSTETAERRADAGWGEAIAYSPDGRFIALGDLGGLVHIWDSKDGKEVRKLEIDDNCRAITSIAFSADGRTLAVNGARAKYHITQWPGCLTVFNLATGETMIKQPLPCTPGDSVFWPDNHQVAMADEGNRVWLWDLGRNRAALFLQHRGHVFQVAGSPDRRFVATADGEVHLWELASGREALRLGKDLWQVCFSTNGLLAAGGHDSIQVWELATGKELVHLQGQRAPCTCLTFSPDGKRLATGFADSTTLVWDLAAAGQPRTAPRALAPADLNPLWETLAGTDAAKAYTSIWALVAAADKSVAFLKEHQHPGNERLKQVPELISDFDSPVFARREAASRKLEKLLPDAESALRKALAGQVSAEQRRRIEALLALPSGIVRDPETLRGLRAIQVLEYVGSRSAREVLCALAKGAPEARLTQEAKTSLDRLTGK
jgi:WD40 repeat protein